MPGRLTGILFVDDDLLVLTALRRALRHEPYALHFTNDPAVALKTVAEQDIDIVVSDYTMPRMNGVQLFAILRQSHASVFRVMLTGHSEKDVLLDPINEGSVFRFIAKPWKNEDLSKLLKEVAVEARARRGLDADDIKDLDAPVKMGGQIP
jgi:DNA-binding NtrC family response regulator